jgi:hypothetical protein
MTFYDQNFSFNGHMFVAKNHLPSSAREPTGQRTATQDDGEHH